MSRVVSRVVSPAPPPMTRWSPLAALVALIACGACGDGDDATGGGGASVSGSGGDQGPSTSSIAGTGGAGGAPLSTTGTATAGGGASGDGGGGGEGGDSPTGEPALYPGGQTHSPITPFVAEGLRAIRSMGPTGRPDVFMKAGASSTVSRSTLFCFEDGPVDLGDHDQLAATLAHFLAGDAAGTSPFARESAAAEVGRTAAWVIAGEPSPLEIELAAISPSLALVHYGTNDLGGGSTYETALVAFHDNLSSAVERLVDEGVVPVLFGITRRGDSDAANRWVATFNAAIRGIAQRAQLPFVDLHHAIDPLDGHGLGGDGLHLEAFAGGACVLDAEGLEHGYNVRNLVALEVLDRVHRVLSGAEAALDPPGQGLSGEGTASLPFEVPDLPFAHAAETSTGERAVDAYPACGDADESGPERWYRIDLPQPRRIRAVVLDREGVDVDVHLVGRTPDGEGCIARGHHAVEASLDAGTYHLAVDTFVDEGVELGGDYLLVVVECDADDPCGA